MEIIITGRYAHTSRGYTTAKHVESGAWGSRENGNVILDRPGRWHLSTTDGFSRRRGCDVRVSEAGEVSGLSSDFDVRA